MSAVRRETVVVEHRWFEYGRWFNGYGSSMDDHRHNDECQWRVRIVTTETHPWSGWLPDAEAAAHAAHLAAQRPTPAPTEES